MVRIITDSAADFSPQEIAALRIHCIPITVMFADAEYQENINLSKDQFYELLLSSGTLPKTAQPSPQLLMDLLEDAHGAGEEAVYITISSAISGTYQNAVMAQKLLGYDTCYVVDSRNATGGQRILVEYAVKLRDEGKSAAQIVAAVEQLRSRIVLFACIDTLEYLYKGGRISQTAYKLGTLVNIKPIITVEKDGSIGIPAKAMGMRKGMDHQCKQVAQKAPDPDFPFYVMYTNTPAVAEALASRLETVGIQTPPEKIIQVGAAVGTHIGPDACGLVYVAK